MMLYFRRSMCLRTIRVRVSDPVRRFQFRRSQVWTVVDPDRWPPRRVGASPRKMEDEDGGVFPADPRDACPADARNSRLVRLMG